MAAAQQSAQAPDISSFGLSKGGTPFPTDPATERAQGRSRQVAVGRRGPGHSRTGSQELDSSSSERDEGESLEASEGDDSEGLESEIESENETVAANDGEGDEQEGEQKGASREDKRTRKQLRLALEKQAEKEAALQRRIDAVEARQNQAQSTQTQSRQQEEPDDDKELDGLLDDGKPGTELLSKDDIKARSDRKKKMESYVTRQAGRHVQGFADRELKALYDMPGAKEIVDWGQKSGKLAEVSAVHQYTASKVFALMTAKHKEDLASRDKKIATLTERIRRDNLDDIPPGMGTRGGRGTGQGSGSGQPQNALQKGWAQLKADIRAGRTT